MFTSSLRRILDVRLLSLAAPLLLSACALHRPDARPDAAPTPALALPRIDLPELDIPLPDDSLLDLMTSESTTPQVTRWVTHAPSFLLVSTSRVASDHATAALQLVAISFARLFGEAPSRIAVAIIDTSGGRPLLDVPEPPQGMTSIVMVGSGLTGGDSTVTAEMLTSELRFEAATAWLFDYAANWRESLGLPGVQPLPDWMHVALLRMLITPDSAIEDAPPARAEKAMSLDELFAHHVSHGEADAALEAMRSPSALASVLGDTHDSDAERQHGVSFANESLNALVFLRSTMGVRAFADIVGATAAGMPMPEILRRLPEPMTTAELNVAFHAWSNANASASNHSVR
jgi:hypothetical protein